MIAQNQIVAVCATAVCTAAGVGLGYLVTKKRFESVYAEMLQEEIENTKEFYKGLYEKKLEEGLRTAAVVDENVTFTSADQDFAKSMEKYEPVDLNEIPEDVAEEIMANTSVEEASAAILRYSADSKEEAARSDTKTQAKKPERVFYNNISKKDTPKVPEARTMVPLKSDIPGEELPESPKAPYIISQDTFMSAELDYDQETVTYYDVDGVVANQGDVPLGQVNDTIGLSNLTKFGELSGSGDSNVLYVRCERLKTDYEIVRDMGMYSEKVLNLGAD